MNFRAHPKYLVPLETPVNHTDLGIASSLRKGLNQTFGGTSRLAISFSRRFVIMRSCAAGYGNCKHNPNSNETTTMTTATMTTTASARPPPLQLLLLQMMLLLLLLLLLHS